MKVFEEKTKRFKISTKDLISESLKKRPKGPKPNFKLFAEKTKRTKSSKAQILRFLKNNVYVFPRYNFICDHDIF